MSIIAAGLGIVFIIIVLWDAFETVVLPRRVTRKLRLTRLFYRYTWRLWSALAHSVLSGKRLENSLSFYGPLSLPFLLGVWASILVIGFAFLYWAPGNAIKTPEGAVSFAACIYFSGTTFFTLGLGDVVPGALFARLLIVLEAGMGFGFLAMVISYLPALNQSFSIREVSISLLDARAGSPPTVAEIIRRNIWNGGEELRQLLHEWERWSAELLESHLSFPVLVYFRSQHDNQSWLGAITSILDTSAFAIVNMEGACQRQAQLTFAIARHAIVDLALVLHCPLIYLRTIALPHQVWPTYGQFSPRRVFISVREAIWTKGCRSYGGCMNLISMPYPTVCACPCRHGSRNQAGQTTGRQAHGDRALISKISTGQTGTRIGIFKS